jgi:hypothetical protein
MESVNLAGCWIGVATGDANFRYHWCLQQTGNMVSGAISLAMPDGSWPGSYEMRGVVEGRTLRFEGVQFIRNPGCWCLASGELWVFVTADGTLELHGSWGALDIPGGCPEGTGGEVFLRRN